ncbi:acetylornithine deacetylase [uncultured Alsobacter sp.]|uniref:acetylornithine deacetylase n=1 Tax=uncultured Alsobacter sp. TaxID=1748258 RepID=UPI0025F091F8|nr:acetylornithine deacetylase [uncultured Alsobacter sp.]
MIDPSPLALLSRLVGFDTESSKSNLPLVDFVCAYLDEQGVPYVRLPNAAGDKAAIYATLGPMVDGGIVLSGHTDVVPVTGQAWTTDPFTLRIADGRAYGRGAVDMKGFDAIVLSQIPEMKRLPLQRPIHILLSYDEETTCLGVIDAIRRMGAEAPRPGVVFVGEPTELEVADAHKSVVTFVTSVHGHESHSSKPYLGANAVSGGAALVAELDRLGDVLRAAGDPSGRFDPPYATVHVGTIHGGTARNIVPKLCTLHWEVRGVPGTDELGVARDLTAFGDRVVLPRLRADGWPASIETVMDVNVPGLKPEPGSAAETLALRLAGRNQTVTVPYGTEAGQFQRQGLPTVVCGPGSINQAHQPDEYITLAEIDRGVAFIRRLVESCR